MTGLRRLLPCCWTCVAWGMWAAWLLTLTFALLVIGARL